MLPFENLIVYKEAIELVNTIYTLIQSWPKNEIFGLSDQFKRAAVSIALNIAEGSSRTKKDFRHFLDLSRGSCYEVIAILAIAKNRNYITPIIFNTIYDQVSLLTKRINALKRSLL